MHAESLQFSLDEAQWQNDWAELLNLASQPGKSTQVKMLCVLDFRNNGLFSSQNELLVLFSGASLEQTHIFALAHILRRPIIVYGVKYVKSFRGESLGLARFQGNVHTFYCHQ